MKLILHYLFASLSLSLSLLLLLSSLLFAAASIASYVFLFFFIIRESHYWRILPLSPSSLLIPDLFLSFSCCIRAKKYRELSLTYFRRDADRTLSKRNINEMCYLKICNNSCSLLFLLDRYYDREREREEELGAVNKYHWLILLLHIAKLIFITLNIFHYNTRGASPTEISEHPCSWPSSANSDLYSRKQEFFLINREPIDRTVHSRKPRIVYPAIGRHDWNLSLLSTFVLRLFWFGMPSHRLQPSI